jgi:hypothetical protein
MSENMLQYVLRHDYVGACEWDRRLATVPDGSLVDPSFGPLLVSWARAMATSFGASYREMIEGEHARASGANELAQNATEDMEEHVAATESQYSAAPGGSALVGSLLAVAYLLAVASEAYLNKSVLPWILGVSGLGVGALMVGPAFILPQALERLSHGLLTATSKCGTLMRGVLYVAVSVLILTTVALIGLCRGAVNEIKNGNDMTAQQSQIVDTTLLVLGVCVAVCAVIAAYSAGLEFKRALHLKQLKNQLVNAKSDLRLARETWTSAAAALASAKKRLEICDELSKYYEEEFLAARIAEIGARLAQIKTNTATTKMLDWAEKLAVFTSLGLGLELSVLTPDVPSEMLAKQSLKNAVLDRPKQSLGADR